MASFNVSVHNSSPLISYTAAWLDTPVGDAFAANYTGGGFHTTSSSGATAAFTFNGTGVWFYGARRPGYGSYSLIVDGNTVSSGSAGADNPVFDSFLAGSSNLGMGEHTAVFTNTGGGAVDLDSLVFETHIGTEGQQVVSQAVDDTDAMMIYLPSAAEWSLANNSIFSNGSVHFTDTADADVAFTFTGDAVAVYGGVSFDHGDYTVNLDGRKLALNGANGQARMYHPQSLLYFATGLGSGTHSVDISAGNGFFDLDSVVIYRATGGNDSHSSGGMEMSKPDNLHVNAANGNNASTGGAVVQNQPISKAVIAGIVAASLLGLVSIIAITIFLVSQCRKRRATTQGSSQGPDGQSPVLPIQHPDLEAGLGPSEKKPADVGKRSTNRFTMKSVASRWSQASYASGLPPGGDKPSEIPPVPPMPMPVSLPANPKLNMPVPQHTRGASSGGSSVSSTLYSPDGDSVLDNYYYRQSVGSQNSDAPLRPARPPGLTLDLGNSFDHVPL